MGSRATSIYPTKVSLPALTEKDCRDVALGLELGVDYLALSFVREAADVQELQALTGAYHSHHGGGQIEDQHAVKRIRRIIKAVDAIMVARGDLGVECPYEELPSLNDTSCESASRLGNRW